MFNNPQKEGKSTESATNKTGMLLPPTISLPKGGGAIRGIGEKFAANPVTGTGSMSVPIYTSPGRSGFGPQLSLSYDSGSGNGPFGFGWNLSLPSITRKTGKGLPQYQDTEESDAFILSGAEDLEPCLREIEDPITGEKTWIPEEPIARGDYTVTRYRPRTEGLFARIEKWTKSGKIHHWRSISRDNITTLYGKDNNSRIFDPHDPDFDPNDPDSDHPKHIFSWLICESYDDKGNAIVYKYKPENSEKVELSHINEKNRTREANRYLKYIKYGNRTPNRDDKWNATDPTQLSDWMFEVVFDYGEHYSEDEHGQPATVSVKDDQREWNIRHDPFSSYRAGFEGRTYRLCQRVLMFHHFPGEQSVGQNCLVRSTEFHYDEGPVASFITGITQSGYVRQNNDDHPYLKKSLPPLEFKYSQAIIQEKVQEIDAESLENLPYGLDGGRYQWVDLDGEGLSGILTEQVGEWFYKRNLSPMPKQENGKKTIVARFAPLELVRTRPSLADVTSGRQQFIDLAGDGQLDLVQLERPLAGYYERTTDADWERFTPFISCPDIAWNDPNLKFVDLTGDGHADVLITEDKIFTWYPSLAEEGFGPGEKTHQSLDEEHGPRLVFADGTQSIYLADFSGDGLADLVRICNGEVCYWPNLGYGRFGAKVTMDNAPWFDYSDLFDQKRIRLADIDGSGTTDILYLGRGRIAIYRNQSGNNWSDPEYLTNFPQIDNLAAVQMVDLLGNGTACLVWSSPLPGDGRRPMRYIALMEEKPHLLVSVRNNLGAETKVYYAPSTKFYLDDKKNGTPWITKLPFPVHVVERVETYDYISLNCFVTRYAYHHGYFDGIEREFRGFGMVEQWDTEDYESDFSQSANNHDPVTDVPLALTRTWFHTGAYIEDGRVSKQFEHEYYREGDASRHEAGLTDLQLEAMLLDDTILPVTIRLADGTRISYTLSGDEAREACRSLKGEILRQEIYALDKNPDGTSAEEADRPYIVSERNYTIEILQPQGPNKHAVFFTYPREAIDFHYERKLYEIGQQKIADPRVSHALTLEVDGYGNVLKSASIAYGRRKDATDVELSSEDRKKQRLIHITCTENTFTSPYNPAIDPSDQVGSMAIDEADTYRIPLPAETRTYELRKAQQEQNVEGQTILFQFNDVLTKVIQAGDGEHDVSYEDLEFTRAKKIVTNDPGQSEKYFRRLIEHVRTLYRPNKMGIDENDPLFLLPLGAIQSLALVGESYKLVFTSGLAKEIYVDSSRIPQSDLDSVLANEGKYVHSAGDTNWWVPTGRIFYSMDASDDAEKEQKSAREHFFLPYRFSDPFGNTTIVEYDDYKLLTEKTSDPIGNVVRAQNDYRVLQPWQMTDPNDNRSAIAFDEIGLVIATAVMGKENETDLEKMGDMLNDPTIRLEYDLFNWMNNRQPAFVRILAREKHRDPSTRWQESYSYSDGFGREIQKKIQAEPGQVEVEDAAGNITIVDTTPNLRWVGSGWTIFNNKGKPVRQYEPFFSTHHQFQFGKKIGVSPILFYDPVERVIATLHPNHTYKKVVFDPWQQQTYDVNDTVTASGTENGDPRTDPHIKGYVAEYFKTQPVTWQTWYQQRINDTQKPYEQAAAKKTAVHANTPTIAHFDTLGRTFLTIAHNKFERDNSIIEERYPTRLVLDIESNQREVWDEWTNAQNNREQRVVMRYDYDMLSNRIHQASMEAGERWTLNNIAGKPIRAWDGRGFTRRMTYDALQRPIGLYVTETGNEQLVELTVYGEAHPQAEALNLRGKAFMQFGGAGVVTNSGQNPQTGKEEAYDFKGNLLRSTRQIASEHKQQINWLAVEPAFTVTPGTKFDLNMIAQAITPFVVESFTTSTTFDAFNRPTSVITPDRSVYRPMFNEANLLDKLEVNLRGEKDPAGKLVWMPFVTNINYNAKGQRTFICYANGAETMYKYDDQTFRPIHLKTIRPPGLNGLASKLFADPTTVQDLHYTYDPAGNITSITDDAISTILYNNEQVDPDADYIYDAIYRLISAQGREHIGQTSFDFNPPDGNYRDYPFVGLRTSPNDPKALRNYHEVYDYDEVGNLKSVRHAATDGNWTRVYTYNELSLLEVGKKNNRLTLTQIGNGTSSTETYSYTDVQGNDVHGCMTSINSMQMKWDFKDQLQMVDLQGGGKAYYVYDATGHRVRKVIYNQHDKKQKECIYVGGFEVYREYNTATGVKELERETLHIMDDNQRIALIETRTQGNEPNVPKQLIRYQFGNHLGSASLELDDQAQVISYEEYYPYGSTSYQSVRSQTETPKRYRYTGKERDEESGLYYHGARYYLPWLGRWLSCDPLEQTSAHNRYIYVDDNPVTYRDPDGLEKEEKEGAAWWQYVLGVPLMALGFVFGGLTGGIDAANAPGPNTKTVPRLTVGERAKNIAPLLIGAGAAGLAKQTLKTGLLAEGAVFGGATSGSGLLIDDISRGEISSLETYAFTVMVGSATGAALWGVAGMVSKGVGVVRWGARRFRPEKSIGQINRTTSSEITQVTPMGFSKPVSETALRDIAKSVARNNPIVRSLRRLADSRTQSIKSIEKILTRFEKQTGIVVRRVKEGARGKPGNPGGFELREGRWELHFEEQLFKDPKGLFNEVTHEINAWASGHLTQGMPYLAGSPIYESIAHVGRMLDRWVHTGKMKF